MIQDNCLLQDKFAAFAGIALTEAHDGVAKARVQLGKEHLNGAGVVQGGLLFTLADYAMAAAVNSWGEARYVSLSVQIEYMKAVSEGTLEAVAKVVKRGNTIQVADAEIVQLETGKILALVRGTFFGK